MASRLSQEEENYIRMCLLITGISTRAARIVFDREFAPSYLNSTLNKKFSILKKLRNEGKINQIHWNLLFRNKPDVPDSKTFDVTLMTTLLRHLTDLTPPGGYDRLPSSNETTPLSDLARIKHYRNFIAHLAEDKIDDTKFTTAWDIVTDAISRLGGQPMKQECDNLKVKKLDQSNQEIILVIKRSNDEIKKLKKVVESLKKANKDLTIEMKKLKMSHEGTVPWNIREMSPTERDFFGPGIFENLRSKYTQLAYWRRGLTEVLKDHEFDETEGKKVLNFLLSIFRFAIVAAKDHGPGATVKILNNLVPNHLNLVSWRRILVGMNIVLDEPDANNDIRLIGVTLSKKYKREIIMETLDEFFRLLVLLKDCNWQVLQTIIDMDEGYPMALLEILDYCKVHDIAPVRKQKNLKILYEIDLFAMRHLGFYRAHPTEPVLWERPANNAHLMFISILYALYGSLIRDFPGPNTFHSLPFL